MNSQERIGLLVKDSNGVFRGEEVEIMVDFGKIRKIGIKGQKWKKRQNWHKRNGGLVDEGAWSRFRGAWI